jgi:hypothetical protein
MAVATVLRQRETRAAGDGRHGHQCVLAARAGRMTYLALQFESQSLETPYDLPGRSGAL